jgi:hypothetical protein
LCGSCLSYFPSEQAHPAANDSAPEVTKDAEAEKSTEPTNEPAAEAKEEDGSQRANVGVDQQSTQAEAAETCKTAESVAAADAAETPKDAEPADDAAPESQRGTPNKAAEAAMEPSCIKATKTRKRVADEAAPLEPKKSKA